jgi:hypothetical protein
VITADYGPRILHLSAGDCGNILFVDTADGLTRGDWHIRGGHRLWISPESEDTYSADNSPCEVALAGDAVSISHLDKTTRLRKTVAVAQKGENFHITNTIENKGECLYPGAIWSLTCVKPQGCIFFPWGKNGPWTVKKILYWKSWMTQSTQLRSTQYHEGDDLFLIRPTGETGKVGTGGDEGFIGVTHPGYTFIKKFDRVPGNCYPDDNCAIEAYTCAHMMELETLSPATTFFPGEPVSHSEEWFVFDTEMDPEDGQAIRKSIGAAV